MVKIGHATGYPPWKNSPMKNSITTIQSMKRKTFLLGATSAVLLASPAMGAITLTNGDFSTADTKIDGVGWTAGPSSGTMFTIAGGVNGVANAPTGNNAASLYQTFSDTTMTKVNVSFDFIIVAPGNGTTPRQIDFRLLTGTTSGTSTHVRFNVSGDGFIDFTNAGGGFVDTTTTGTAFAANVAGTYRIDLQLDGMDGNGGATGTMLGTITRASDNASYSFSGTNLNWAAVDSMEFLQGNNWGSNHNVDFDNVFVAVPEPSAALLGGLGVLALLRRRRA